MFLALVLFWLIVFLRHDSVCFLSGMIGIKFSFQVLFYKVCIFSASSTVWDKTLCFEYCLSFFWRGKVEDIFIRCFVPATVIIPCSVSMSASVVLRSSLLSKPDSKRILKTVAMFSDGTLRLFRSLGFRLVSLALLSHMCRKVFATLGYCGLQNNRSC